MPSATDFLRNRTHLPPVAHRWRSFLALQRREAEVEKAKRLGGGGSQVPQSRFSLLPFLPLGVRPECGRQTLEPPPRIPAPGV